MSALRWRKSGSAVQKDKASSLSAGGKKVASRTVNDENIFSFSSQTVVLTLTWNKRGLKNPAAAVKTLETKAQEDKIQTVLL